MLDAVVNPLLDFPCVFQVVPDKIVAFEHITMHDYDAIILPLRSSETFATSTFVEIVGSIGGSVPTIIYMIEHDDVVEGMNIDEIVRLTPESAIPLPDLVHAISAVLAPNHTNVVSVTIPETQAGVFLSAEMITSGSSGNVAQQQLPAAVPVHSMNSTNNKIDNAASKRQKRKRQPDQNSNSRNMHVSGYHPPLFAESTGCWDSAGTTLTQSAAATAAAMQYQQMMMHQHWMVHHHHKQQQEQQQNVPYDAYSAYYNSDTSSETSESCEATATGNDASSSAYIGSAVLLNTCSSSDLEGGDFDCSLDGFDDMYGLLMESDCTFD